MQRGPGQLREVKHPEVDGLFEEVGGEGGQPPVVGEAEELKVYQAVKGSYKEKS